MDSIGSLTFEKRKILNKKENPIYISLQEATGYCDYSQEYLALRARQGKLKAVKFGRNWITKKEWLEEYLQKVEEYNNNLNNKKIARKKFIAPPENLPIEEIPFPFIKFVEQKLKTPALRFGFITTLIFILVIAGGIFGKTSFQNIFDDASSLAREFNENFDKGVADLAENISSGIYLTNIAGDIITEEITKPFKESFVNVGYQTADVGDLFKEYGQWIIKNYFSADDWVEKEIEELVGIFKEAPKSIDNDCDGLIDEDLTQKCGSSNVGACQFGTKTCSAGIWGECLGAVEPTEEICYDNIDNNCDGQIDEECQTQGVTSTATSTD